MTESHPFGVLEKGKVTPFRRGRKVVQRQVKTLRMQFAAVCKKRIPLVLQNALFFGGLASVTLGFWMIYRPLAPIIGGALAVWIGMLISAETDESRS